MHLLRRFLTLAVLALPALSRLAAQPLENAVFTVGTTATDAKNHPWAYLAMQPTDPTSLSGRQLAIYSKPGDANSASNYVRKSIVSLQTEPLVIQGLLARAEAIGDNLGQLENRIDNLYAAVMPSTNLDLATKISIVIRGALSAPENFGNLVLLGRLHPSITLCLGLGQLEPIGAGDTTFEVRDFDLKANQDRAVLGRVTVTAGAPVVLPAPGKPALVPDASGKGHLNAKLRWATSPQFRRLALLSQGFDLFRVPKAVAAASGYTNVNNPPTIAQLRGNPSAIQVNDQPIFKTRDYDNDMAAADTTTDPKTFFISDDNGLALPHNPGVKPPRFTNGEQFYYFIAARDLLGRDGLVSPGTLVTMCDRVPPNAPHLPAVVNNYTFNGVNEIQWLQVNWRPVTNSNAGESIVGYYIYRWNNPSEALQFGDDPTSHRVSPLIPHIAGQTLYSFVDNGAGAPSTPANFGQTFWYTIRAIDNGACDGGNYSGNSAAAFGVLRDRNGPGSPVGGAEIECCSPEVLGGKPSEKYPTNGIALSTNLVYLDITCARTDPGIVWAEFLVEFVNGGTNFLGHFEFPNNSDNLDVPVTFPRSSLPSITGQIVYCRVGDAQGNASSYAQVTDGGLPIVTTRGFSFNALTVCQRVLASQAAGALAGRGCNSHQTPPGPSGVVMTNSGINVIIEVGTNSVEYKLYRRVDFGALTLLREGTYTNTSVTNLVVVDTDMPANSGTICYYAQIFDKNGNSSPLTPLGECVEFLRPTPNPILNPIEAVGISTSPQMGLHWFCPVVGIQRFEVLVATAPGKPPLNLGAPLAADSAVHPNWIAPNPSQPTNKQDFAVYLSPTPGIDFGPGPAFDLNIPIQLGVTYTVQIRAIGLGGAVGGASKYQTFKWTAPPTTPGPMVPWPARSTVASGVTPSTVVALSVTNTIYAGAAVVVGRVQRQQLAGNTSGTITPNLHTSVQALDLIYTNQLGQSLFPLALYRYQVPNANYPKVSGDLIQASPLMDTLALTPGFDTQNQPCLVWKEPFAIAPINSLFGTVDLGYWPVLLLDTQPVLRGASYVYLLVRFGTDGEPTEILPTQPVTISP